MPSSPGAAASRAWPVVRPGAWPVTSSGTPSRALRESSSTACNATGPTGVAVPGAPSRPAARSGSISAFRNPGRGRRGRLAGPGLGGSRAIRRSPARFWGQCASVYGCPATGLGFAGELSERSIRNVASPVLFIEEEMDSFISNSKRDTKIGIYLRKAWDGSTINHKTSQTDLVIMKPHVAIVGHVQPKNWGAISGSKDATGGTYNRFFPLWVTRSKKLPVFSAENSEETIKMLGNRFRSMVNFAQEVTDITVPADVAEIFELKHREICDGLTTGNEELGQYTERAMAYMIRIAGLYCLADKRTELKVEDFDAALALVQYMVETVTYTLPEAESDGSDIPARIVAYIREAGESAVTSTEVARRFQRVRAAEIRAIVESCEQIRTSKMRSEGGRPATLFTWLEDSAQVTDGLAVAV
ncbi:DUF3987 domain-containing protein [Sphaerisporangium sp. NPDC005288]|uniref:DUF3987 domain-containing protein n=1 Tax=Sphaerisporangium sp. NPDC005288 TaxID=3155114 RepID=UPI0033B53E31